MVELRWPKNYNVINEDDYKNNLSFIPKSRGCIKATDSPGEDVLDGLGDVSNILTIPTSVSLVKDKWCNKILCTERSFTVYAITDLPDPS